MTTAKKIILALLTFLALICLGLVMLESQTHLLHRFYDDSILDNKNHYLPCAELPAETEVLALLQQHQDTLRTIEAVNPGLVGVEIDTTTCPGKADLVIWYASHADRLEIERILGDETFFGIPCRLQNR